MNKKNKHSIIETTLKKFADALHYHSVTKRERDQTYEEVYTFLETNTSNAQERDKYLKHFEDYAEEHKTFGHMKEIITSLANKYNAQTCPKEQKYTKIHTAKTIIHNILDEERRKSLEEYFNELLI